MCKIRMRHTCQKTISFLTIVNKFMSLTFQKLELFYQVYGDSQYMLEVLNPEQIILIRIVLTYHNVFYQFSGLKHGT